MYSDRENENDFNEKTKALHRGKTRLDLGKSVSRVKWPTFLNSDDAINLGVATAQRSNPKCKRICVFKVQAEGKKQWIS